MAKPNPFFTQRSHRAVHFACFACRVAFKKPSVDLLEIAESVRFPCPNCNARMQYMGRSFKAPRRNAIRQWRKVELLIRSGFRFDTYVGGELPRTLRETEEFLKSLEAGDPSSGIPWAELRRRRRVERAGRPARESAKYRNQVRAKYGDGPRPR